MSAMDVICTLHEGKYSCTPFYVVFYSLFQQPIAEKVHILVNYKPLHDIVMFKDETGVVHFQTDGGDNTQIPSQEFLKIMNLKSGSNAVAFATEVSQQMVSARIFLWDINEKIVVTDIDGTITRSDKRGHFYSRIGLSWHHNSVSNCFQKVYDLGYKVLYLTARSVSMDQSTKRYLTDLGLPLGPLLLSPKGFVEAFTSEVITKDARMGKLEHLKNVIGIFPECNELPIVAGFGNNENDEWAYKTVGIPPDHIFIVNKKSQIVVGGSATSYEVVTTEVLKFFKCLVSNLKTSNEFLPQHNQETVKKEMAKIEKGESSIEAGKEEEQRVPHMTEDSSSNPPLPDTNQNPDVAKNPNPPFPEKERSLDLHDDNTDSPILERNRHLQPGGADSPTAIRIRRGKEKLGHAYHAVKSGILVEFGDLLKM